ncbi:MAG: hypothetical protein JNJ59_09650 [Deltaproteobacteria bacterium]|nr:hypothetical protein [Deltaproteobacteria bacterium]
MRDLITPTLTALGLACFVGASCGGDGSAQDTLTPVDTSDTSDGTGDGADADEPIDTLGEDADVDSVCCPIEAPSCNCFALGGNRIDGSCPSVCDAPPVGWTQVTDRFGCPEWVGGSIDGCWPVPDADDGDTHDGETADADTSEPGEVDPLFGTAGEVEIIEQYSGGLGEVAGSWVYVALRDRVSPEAYRLAAEDGACRVYLAANASCEPACGEGEVCDANARCADYAVGVSAGDITITGLAKGPYTAKHVGDGQYVTTPEPPSDGLFAAGDAITVSAAGDAIPAFTAAVSGVADLLVPNIGLVELTDQVATTFSWTPAGDGSRVELRLQLGWHGRPPTGIIACAADDAAGHIVVSPTVIKPFPYFGGIGLFQVPSWAARVSRTFVETPAGPIAVSAESRVNLGVSHTTE